MKNNTPETMRDTIKIRISMARGVQQQKKKLSKKLQQIFSRYDCSLVNIWQNDKSTYI